MRFVLRGVRLVWQDPDLRALIWQPILLGLALMTVLLGLTFWAATGIVFGLLQTFGWGHLAPGSFLFGLAVVGILIWFGGPLFIAIATFVSGFMWDKLSRRVEFEVYGDCPPDTLLPSAQVADILFRLGYAAFTVLLIIGFSIAQLPWVGYLLIGVMGLYDFTAAAYHRRHVNFLGQVPRVWRTKGALGFVLSAALFAVIPILNVIMLPSLVAGGTLMVLQKLRSDDHSRSLPEAKAK